MSLTGIALAIGVIVDNGIIMSENAYQHLSQRYAQWESEQKNEPNSDEKN
jgi:Cu/Ag efflux pump CusA